MTFAIGKLYLDTEPFSQPFRSIVRKLEPSIILVLQLHYILTELSSNTQILSGITLMGESVKGEFTIIQCSRNNKLKLTINQKNACFVMKKST